jgi:hypothetical protein
MAKTLFDHLNAISKDQKPDYFKDLSEEDKKTWSNYMIHRFLSMNYDFVDMIAQFQPLTQTLEPELFYKLLIGTIPSGRYYFRYIKGKSEETSDETIVQLLKQEYSCSKSTAIDYYHILTCIKEGEEYKKYLKDKYGIKGKEKLPKTEKVKKSKK